MVSRSASISSRILSLSVMRMCGIDSAELIWLVIAVSFFRNSSSRSRDEAVACTVIRVVSEVAAKNSTSAAATFRGHGCHPGRRMERANGAKSGRKAGSSIASARVRSFGGNVKRIVVALFAVLLTLPAFAVDTRAAADRDRDRNANVVDEVIRMWH